MALPYPATLDLSFIGRDTLDPRITFTRADATTCATYFDTAGVLQTAAANVPRFDYNPTTLAARGLLIEESRTNSIRNNTMQGAVAGTPGTVPTNWIFASSVSGISRQIVGTGTESGVAYIDVRYSGTSTSSGTTQINAETTTGVAALTGQTWTVSSYLKLAGGSFPGVLSIIWQERDSGGVAVLNASVGVSTPTTASLRTQRYSSTRTLSGGASVAYVTARIDVNIPNATVVDFTLRIGLPQLERGAFATSVIPTTSAAVTREKDDAVVTTLTPWFNASSGTLYAEYNIPVAAQNQHAASLSDGTNNNRMIIRATNSSTQTVFLGVDTTVTQWVVLLNTSPLNATTKSAFAYAPNDIAWVRDGGTVGTDTTATIPTVSQLRLGADGDGSFRLCGHLRAVRYYPTRLSNTDLQAITA